MSLVRKSIFKQITRNLYDFLDRVKVYKFISSLERVFPCVVEMFPFNWFSEKEIFIAS